MTQSASVGIDVSKSKLDVCIISNSKYISFVVSNDQNGIITINDTLVKNKVSNTTQIVIESTGDYHLLAAFSLSNSYAVKVINPLIARQHMNNSIRKVKSDKVDARLLAVIGLKQELSSHVFSKQELKKKKLVKLTNALEKHIAALKLSHKNMQATFNQFGLESPVLESLHSEIKSLRKILRAVEKELEKLIENQEIAKSISLVAGITRNSANKVLALIENRHFASKSSLIAFSGLDVSVKQSGKWLGKTKVTKRGDSQLRKYLIQIAWGLLMHNQYFQEYIEPYKQKSRKYFELLVIIARKFLKMLYGAIKHSQPFSLNYLTSV